MSPPPVPLRVVSLVPSVTETLLAWGVTPVACTRFCEQPDLPHVGGTKDPDVAAIRDLAPDLVVMCVEENRREDADALAEAGVRTAALSIDGVADVGPALRMLAALAGATPPADDLDRLDALAAGELAGPVAGRGRPLRAFVPIWKRPWMTLSGGTYGSSLLAAVGVHNVYADAADRYPTVTLEEVRERRPDVVLAPSEPYPFGARHVPLFEDVAPVVLVDGRDLFWWGARTPAALRRLADRLAGIDPRG
ncbi:MAG TPA: helical backbone metal receptor [Acidimicrobiales bacterium]|nr:helical backbone metal receptor [Acidimicrobiales bacterium]